MRLFRSVPSSDFACCPPFPPSAQSLALFPSLSIDRSIHPRRRPAPFHAAGLLLPSLPFPSFLRLVCAVARSRDRSRASKNKKSVFGRTRRIGPAFFFFSVTISSSISEVAHDMQRICICALLVSVSLLIVAAEVRDSTIQVL